MRRPPSMIFWVFPPTRSTMIASTAPSMSFFPTRMISAVIFSKRYGEMFETTFDFLFYDITSTYFEGSTNSNPQAKRGYSRDSRPDCPQVCIGLVATKEGLPIAFEIFDGNRPDVTTTQEMVHMMETKIRTGQPGLGHGSGHGQRE